MTFARASRRGFTLIELMIVVVIVGILATMAVVGYRKMVSESHSTEAIQVIQSIRVAQENVHAETGSYANISGTLCTGADPSCGSLYPQAFFAHPSNQSAPSWVVGNFKVGWGGGGNSCTGECAAWLTLPVHSPGAVYHGYSTKAGTAGTTPPTVSINGTNITWPSTASAQDWFVITAVGDVDGDGVAATYLGHSFGNDIISQNEGE